MLVIGHRGAAKLAPENTLEALRAGMEAGADILEFDVRLTRDNIPVLSHDFHTLRTHHSPIIISHHTLEELKSHAGKHPIVTLQEVLDEFLGEILLNIELKSKGSGSVVANLFEQSYVKRKNDWDNVLFSSFKASELSQIRALSPLANLALIHGPNPFLFIAYQRRLRLSAVGFHRLYTNRFAVEIAKKAGLFTYVYTVDRPHAALIFDQQGIDGVVTNFPDQILKEIVKR